MKFARTRQSGVAAAVDDPIEIEQVREPELAPPEQGMVGAHRRHQPVLDQADEAQGLVARPIGHQADGEIEVAGAHRRQNIRVDPLQ